MTCPTQAMADKGRLQSCMGRVEHHVSHLLANLIRSHAGAYAAIQFIPLCYLSKAASSAVPHAGS